jgi:hypothetical protein
MVFLLNIFKYSDKYRNNFVYKLVYFLTFKVLLISIIKIINICILFYFRFFIKIYIIINNKFTNLIF